MISKVHGKQLRKEMSASLRPNKLTALQRCMLSWVVLDPGDKVLDANTSDGNMLDYLYKHMECEICGISIDMECVKQSRCRLQHADIIYAHLQDIPWRQNAFDTVLLEWDEKNMENWDKVFKETMRVLKPGGQFVFGFTCYPVFFKKFIHYVSSDIDNEEMKSYLSRDQMKQKLEEAGFQQISWHSSGLFSGVLIGWNPMERKTKTDVA